MLNSLTRFNADVLIFVGVIGIFLGFTALFYFLFRRIRWTIQKLLKQETTPPKVISSFVKLVLIVAWTSCFGTIFFVSAFLRSYHTFTLEKPIAEIRTQKLDGRKTYPVYLVHFTSVRPKVTRHLFIKGNQWMIEGDILKWNHRLNVLGLHARYRLTRLRGRYINTEAEMHQPRSIHSLVHEEEHPFWRYLYQYGYRLPFVSTVYGNASFQNLGQDKTYLIYVGTSGFIVREKVDQKQTRSSLWRKQ